MLTDVRYSIDKFQFKDIDGIKFFLIFGWGYSKSNDSFDYYVKINDQENPFDIVTLKRSDVYHKYADELSNGMVGFRIRADVLDDEVNCFEFGVKNDQENRTLFKYNKDELENIKDMKHIDYAIDNISFDVEKNIASITGWSYSLDFKDVTLEILDEDHNKVEFSNRITMRSDLVQMHMIVQSQKYCGFYITFLYDKNVKYFLHMITESEDLLVELKQQKYSRLGLFNGYITHLNPENLRKARTYLKENGVKKFLYRLTKGVNTNNEDTYQDWFLMQRAKESDIQIQRETNFSYLPKISLIVATFNTKEDYLKEMIDTVINQSYSNWELCIADGSSNNDVEKYIRHHYKIGDKIKFIRLDKNYGISGNMNAALELATGDYVGLYDHDDMLELDCLFEVVSSLQEYRYDLIYTDEDKFDDGKKEYVDPNFKPDYSEDLFRSHNYITHFFCVNKRIIDEVGGMRSGYDGAQDYDFMFRCIEKANGIHHVARILYHWRMHPLSTAQNPESKMYCYEAGKKAIEQHYKRIGVSAEVEMMPKPMYGMYHTRYSILNEPLVSILIPNMNHKSVLETCINSLYNVNSYKNFEIIIVENNSTEQEIFDYYDQIKKQHQNIKIVTWHGEFNYSAINNFGAKYVKGDYILLLNNDTEMIKPDALSEMLGCCMRKEVGAVGAKLLYADDTVQHAGVVIGFSGYAGHVFNGIDKDDYGYMVRARINCNYSAVTAACMMVKKSVFDEVNGFDEQFRVACNDVDLCLKIREKGYLIVYNAFALWHHYESKSRGYEDNKDKIFRFDSEVRKFQDKWPDILKNGDPYYNKNFNIEHGPFVLW